MNEADKQILKDIERAQEIERLYLSTDCLDVYSVIGTTFYKDIDKENINEIREQILAEYIIDEDLE